MKTRNVILVTIGVIILEYFIDHNVIAITTKIIFKSILCIVLIYILYKEIKECKLRDK